MMEQGAGRLHLEAGVAIEISYSIRFAPPPEPLRGSVTLRDRSEYSALLEPYSTGAAVTLELEDGRRFDAYIMSNPIGSASSGRLSGVRKCHPQWGRGGPSKFGTNGGKIDGGKAIDSSRYSGTAAAASADMLTLRALAAARSCSSTSADSLTVT